MAERKAKLSYDEILKTEPPKEKSSLPLPAHPAASQPSAGKAHGS
jgi:hypothetical protein